MTTHQSFRNSLRLIVVLLSTFPAEAQDREAPPFEQVGGENYHIELAGTLWEPLSDGNVSSESLGIKGSTIDFTTDLGIKKKRFHELRLVLRPAERHKIRVSFLPLRWNTETKLSRDLIFNGIRYEQGLPITSSLELNTWRLAYEYDFLYMTRGFIGALIETKYTDVKTIISGGDEIEFSRARVPIPALGLISRGYVTKNFSITGEFTAFSIPKINEKYVGRYVDFDIYGTLNFVKQFGVIAGYRSISASFQIEQDTGELLLQGGYIGAVIRF